MKQEVEFTNGIPICPYCQEPTIRQSMYSTTTAAYYPPVYNEKGENTNPDRNTITNYYHCTKCDKDYCIAGNYMSGWVYLSTGEKK